MEKSSPKIKYIFSVIALLMVLMAAYGFVSWLGGNKDIPNRQQSEIR